MNWKQYIKRFFIWMPVFFALLMLFEGCALPKKKLPVRTENIEEKVRLKNVLIQKTKCCCNSGDLVCCHEMEVITIELMKIMGEEFNGKHN